MTAVALMLHSSTPDGFLATVAAHKTSESIAANSQGYQYAVVKTSSNSDLSSETKVLVRPDEGLFLKEVTASGKDASRSLNSVDAMPRGYAFRLVSKAGEEWELERYALSSSPKADMKALGFPYRYSRPTSEDFNSGYAIRVTGIGWSPVSIAEAHQNKRLRDIRELDSGDDGTRLFAFQRRRRVTDQWVDSVLTVQDYGDHLPISFEETDADKSIRSAFTHESGESTEVSQAMFNGEPWETTTVYKLDMTPPPPEAFTLSAYGFPEPAELDQPASGSAWPWWLAGAGAAMVAGAAALRRRAA